VPQYRQRLSGFKPLRKCRTQSPGVFRTPEKLDHLSARHRNWEGAEQQYSVGNTFTSLSIRLPVQFITQVDFAPQFAMGEKSRAAV
jgi:hypothetical protein